MTRAAGPFSGLLRRQRRFLAIDFDSRQVRIVQAEPSAGAPRILKLAAADVPVGVDTTDAQALGTFLREVLGRMHLGGGQVLMCVPRGQAILKPLFLPRAASTGELAGMVLYQAEKELTFRPDETVVDFTLESHYGAEPPPEEHAEGVQVLVAAVRRTVVDYYVGVARAAGLKLAGLGLRPYANIRAVQSYGGHGAEARVAILQIMADEAELDVSDAGALTFTRPAAIKVPMPLVEPAAGDAAQTVVTEVTRSLHSYLGVERGHEVTAVLVAGGTGIEPRVAAELRRRLDIPVEPLDPSAALGLEAQGPTASAFISALGLAVSHAPGAGLPLDFLNPKRPPVQRDKRKIRILAGAAALLLAVGSVFGAAGAHYWSAQSRLASLTEQLRELNEANKGVVALGDRVKKFDSWVGGGRDWLDQWAYLSGKFPSCQQAYITSFVSNADGSIAMNVKTNSRESLNELTRGLKSAGYDFEPPRISTSSDPYGYTLSADLKVVVKPDMDVDLTQLPMPVRPENDVSAEKFGITPPPVKPAAPPPAPAPPAPAKPAATTKTPPPTPAPVKPPFGGGGGKGGGGKGRGSGGSL
jgi:Tfp pilus assembly PilM family ATPase